MSRGGFRFAWTLALPLAMWAAVPAVQWCPIPWEQVPRDAFLRCAALMDGPGPGCRVAPAAAAEASAPACASATCERDGHPMGDGCPLASTSPAAAPRERAPHPAHGRAFCLAGPNGGVALSAMAPWLGPAIGQLALGCPAFELRRPAPASVRIADAALARPPTAAWSRLPPARAPPAWS